MSENLFPAVLFGVATWEHRIKSIDTWLKQKEQEHFCNVNCKRRIVEWLELGGTLMHLPWAGTIFTRPACLELHPA